MNIVLYVKVGQHAARDETIGDPRSLTVSTIQFNCYSTVGLQNIIWQFDQQRKCFETLTHRF
jgi:hypothetical protein